MGCVGVSSDLMGLAPFFGSPGARSGLRVCVPAGAMGYLWLVCCARAVKGQTDHPLYLTFACTRVSYSLVLSVVLDGHGLRLRRAL